MLGLVNGSGSSAWSGGRRLAVITGAWCCFAALLTVNNYVYPAMMGQPVSWRDAARFPVINYAIWTLFTPVILFFCEHIRRLHWKAGFWIAAHSAFALLILLLNAAAWIPFAQVGDELANVHRASWHFVSILFWTITSERGTLRFVRLSSKANWRKRNWKSSRANYSHIFYSTR